MTDVPVIHFDYGKQFYYSCARVNPDLSPEFSPIAQKTKLLLTAAGVKFDRVDVPPLIPRKDLEELGITYRRVPILAVGKDIHCDSKVIFDVVLNKLANKAVPTSPTASYSMDPVACTC